MDGNFKADHLRMKHPENDVFITEGAGHGVGGTEFRKHREVATEFNEVSPFYNHAKGSPYQTCSGLHVTSIDRL